MQRRRVRHDQINLSELTLVLAPFIASLLVLAIDQSQGLNIIKYGIYYSIVVIPASIFFASLLLKERCLNLFQKIALGYPIAIVGISLSFAISQALQLKGIIYLLPVVCLVGIFFQRRQLYSSKPNSSEKYGISFSALLLVVYSVASILFFSSFTLTSKPPTGDLTSNVYEDVLWTVGNTWSLLRGGLPLEDSRFSGVELSYHIAQNLYYAATSVYTGITPVDLHLKIAPYYDLYFLIASVVVTNQIFLNKKGWISNLIAVPILFSVIPITDFKIGAGPELFEIFWNPISLVFGLGAFINLVIILSHSKKEGAHFIPIAYTCILFSLAMSSKGILGLLIPAGYCLSLVTRYLATKDKPSGNSLKTIAGMAIVFILLKLSLFAGVEGHTVSPRIEVSPVAITLASKFGAEKIIESLYVIIGPASRFTRFMFHTLVWNWTLMPMIILYLMSKKSRRAVKKNWELFAFTFSFAMISGIIYSLNIFESYWANVYLYRYTIACTSLGLGVFIYNYLADWEITKNSYPIKKILSLGFISIPIVLFGVRQAKWIGSDGWKENRLLKATDIPMRHINASEFKAMEWIRGNISDKSVIASDRKEKIGWTYDYVMDVWFGYSAYSGRQFYNEGADYNPHAVKKVSGDRWEKISKLLNSKSKQEVKQNFQVVEADYLIITKRLQTASDALINYSDIIYENDGIIVVKNPTR